MRKFILSIFVTLIFATNAFAGKAMINLVDIPTLGEWGMIAMFLALGVIGFIALRQRLSAHPPERN